MLLREEMNSTGFRIVETELVCVSNERIFIALLQLVRAISWPVICVMSPLSMIYAYVRIMSAEVWTYIGFHAHRMSCLDAMVS